jgi:C4-dicarboxylate transporter, DctM subunit
MENTTTRVIGKALARIDSLAEPERYRAPARRVGALLQDVLFVVVLVGTGALIVLEDIARLGDRALALFERVFVGLALLTMTLLVFDEYLQRELWFALGAEETDTGWQAVVRALLSIDGKANLAVLLMVLVGFTGASLATRERQHLTVDVMERLLSAPSAQTVRRITRLISAGLCLIFARASAAAVLTHSQDSFEGVRVFPFMVPVINTIVGLLPGEKYGPLSCKGVADRAAAGCPDAAHPSVDAWIDAKYDAGLDPFDLFAFGYVDVGDRFPLWLPLGFLSLVFGAMTLRFLAEAFRPRIARAIRPPPATRSATDVFFAGALPGALGALGLGLWLGEGPLILMSSIVLVLLGAPLFVAVGVGTVASWALLRDAGPETVISDMFEATKKLELLSIPFFVLAGNLMTRGSIASRLIEVARAALGWLPGGLGIGAVAACAMFAAISGSSPVTVIAIGGVMLPMLIREGYPERYAIGVLTTSGGLGIIIPPSIPMIVYAIMVSGTPGVGVVDPAVLFRAGIGPGVFIALVLSAYTLYRFWPREDFEVAPEPLGLRVGQGMKAFGKAVFWGLPSLFLPVLILGGIYGWLTVGGFTVRFTVTEAAAVAVLYALVVELILHRDLRLRDLPGVFAESAMQLGSLFLLIVIAISLNRFFVFEELPEKAAAWMLDWVHSPVQFLIAVNLFLLALGCVMDVLSAILIVAPLLAPVAAQYGIHPVHFAVIFIVNLEIGYLTPPMGINLFVASTVFDRPLVQVILSVLPFLVLMLLALAVIAFFPALSLFLAGV